MDTFDVAVIGAGPGGYVCAIRAAQLGLKTALIDKRPALGGTCLNIGCIPSKALLESSELYHMAKQRFREHGIEVPGVKMDLAALMKRKDKVVKELTDGVRFLMKKNNITTFTGTGSLKGKDRIVVAAGDGSTTEIRAKNIVLATGSEPVELPFMKFDGKHIVSSDDALSFDSVPGHLVVVGAGAIGLEMGSVWSRLGSKVTVLEMLSRAAPFSDEEVGRTLERSLRKQGLEFHFETKVTGATVKNGKVTVTFETSAGEKQSVECDRVLVSVGRRPYAKGLGIESAGLSTDKRGFIEVDKHYRTAVATIYAIGDLIGGAMLAHKAEDEGMAVAELIAGKPGHVNYSAIPNVIYTSPELAQVGMTEAEAKERGIECRTGVFHFRGNGRAKALGETDGLVKIVADAKTDRLLGVHIVGPRASEMIAESALAIEFGGSAEDIALTCHPHPTLTEAVREAALDVGGRKIHG